MTKTMKQLADEAERRWSRQGLSDAQKVNMREQRKFAINPKPKKPDPVIRDALVARRIEVDNKLDELRTARGLKDVWEM